jgi:K+-sensing histidine kinase KdpD
MRVLGRGIPFAVSVAVICIVTAALWYAKLATAGPHDPVFLYVLPIMVLAICFGKWPALVGIFAAFACADFFLYDPLYTLGIYSRAEFADLFIFAALAGVTVTSVSHLFAPSHRLKQTTNRAPPNKTQLLYLFTRSAASEAEGHHKRCPPPNGTPNPAPPRSQNP